MNEQAGIEMPKYECHKTVHALKIRAITSDHYLHPADDRYAAFPVSTEYMQKHNPQPGGYYVVYADGYTSFSPADVFESGYALVMASADIGALP